VKEMARDVMPFITRRLPVTCSGFWVTRLSAGGVADEWVTQLLRQRDAKVFKKYSQMKLQMKREALQKLNRAANEAGVLRQAG